MILDDFKTALDLMRTHWMQKKNGDLFVTPNTTPKSSPRAYRRRGDLESTGSLGYSCTVLPASPTAKKCYNRAMPMDHIEVKEEIRIQSARLEAQTRDEIEQASRERYQISEDIPEIPLRRM